MEVARLFWRATFFHLIFVRAHRLWRAQKSQYSSASMLYRKFIFKFLMADQTVPRNDINKLTGRDFRFLKNRRGKVTHIDFEYFKSRSRKRHETRIIDTKTQIGQALLSFLDDRITHHSIDKPLVRSDFNTKIEHNFGPNTPRFMEL